MFWMYMSAILSSKFDEFVAVQSQFNSDHFYAPTCCQSATFGPLFAFYCPLFITGGNNKKCRILPATRRLRCATDGSA